MKHSLLKRMTLEYLQSGIYIYVVDKLSEPLVGHIQAELPDTKNSFLFEYFTRGINKTRKGTPLKD